MNHSEDEAPEQHTQAASILDRLGPARSTASRSHSPEFRSLFADGLKDSPQLLKAPLMLNQLLASTEGLSRSSTPDANLLNKGQKEVHKPGQRVVPQVETFEPLVLLDRRPTTKASDQRGGDHDRDAQASTFAMGAQMERLYNIHGRAELSPKRQHSPDVEQRKKIKANGYSSSPGVLIHQTNNAGPTQPGQTVAIDLTNTSDGEEEPPVKDAGMELVCLGRLKNTYIQTHMVPYQSAAKHQGNHNTQSRIKVRFRRAGSHKANSVISALDPSGTEFGRVDLRTANGLAPLMDGAGTSQLRWAAMTEPRKRNKGEGLPGSPSSALIGVTIQLYCPRKVALPIGKFLTTRSIALDDPIFDRDRYPYFNPQVTPTMPYEPQPGTDGYQNGEYSGRVVGNVMRSVEEIRNDVHNMFTNIINEEIPDREQGPLIVTPLLKHQRQALGFMLDREKERTGKEENGMWRLKYGPNGKEYWSHVITGHEVYEKPASVLGGILADEMGLGKTLETLALIVDPESLNAATEFATKEFTDVRNHNNKATLLVAPVSTISNWEDQLKAHVKPYSVKWCIYHGVNRAKNVNELDGYDIVMTTYSTVAAEYRKGKPLESINWFRIVLDEAHSIRTQKTKQSQSICALKAQRRWAVTGTPVQNRLEDLGALFKFLRVRPFDEMAGFQEFILQPFKNADPDVVAKLQLLVSSLTLRRVKKGLVDLPPRHDQIVRLKFSKDEQTLHDWFEKDSARKVNAVTAGDKKLGGNVYAKILSAILNLRLICAHGQELLSDEAMKMTEGMSWDNAIELGVEDDDRPAALSKKQAYEMLNLLQETDSDKCQMCSSKITQDAEADEDEEGKKPTNTLGFMTACYHIICPKCINTFRAQINALSNEQGHFSCQFCEQNIRNALYELKVDELESVLAERERLRKDPKLAKKLGRYIGPHTKTKALVESLQQDRAWSEAHPEEAPIKSVVFSTWTTHLDLIQIALDNHDFKYTRLDGRMKRTARGEAIQTFTNDPSVHIMLVSIAAGGLGLNLTVANKAYVMEPQFNPAAEAQAVDRVHRLGQMREVTITRFIMANSFEEKMLELQRKKRALADLTMAREKLNKEDVAKQKLEDLRSLFR